MVAPGGLIVEPRATRTHKVYEAAFSYNLELFLEGRTNEARIEN